MLPGSLSLSVFYDTGTVSINHDPYAAGDNNRRLSGAGLGVTLAKPRNFEARLSYASKVGNSSLPVNTTDKSSQYWLQVSKAF